MGDRKYLCRIFQSYFKVIGLNSREYIVRKSFILMYTFKPLYVLSISAFKSHLEMYYMNIVQKYDNFEFGQTFGEHVHI